MEQTTTPIADLRLLLSQHTRPKLAKVKLIKNALRGRSGASRKRLVAEMKAEVVRDTKKALRDFKNMFGLTAMTSDKVNLLEGAFSDVMGSNDLPHASDRTEYHHNAVSPDSNDTEIDLDKDDWSTLDDLPDCSNQTENNTLCVYRNLTKVFQELNDDYDYGNIDDEDDIAFAKRTGRTVRQTREFQVLGRVKRFSRKFKKDHLSELPIALREKLEKLPKKKQAKIEALSDDERDIFFEKLMNDKHLRTPSSNGKRRRVRREQRRGRKDTWERGGKKRKGKKRTAAMKSKSTKGTTNTNRSKREPAKGKKGKPVKGSAAYRDAQWAKIMADVKNKNANGSSSAKGTINTSEQEKGKGKDSTEGPKDASDSKSTNGTSTEKGKSSAKAKQAGEKDKEKNEVQEVKKEKEKQGKQAGQKKKGKKGKQAAKKGKGKKKKQARKRGRRKKGKRARKKGKSKQGKQARKRGKGKKGKQAGKKGNKAVNGTADTATAKNSGSANTTKSANGTSSANGTTSTNGTEAEPLGKKKKRLPQLNMTESVNTNRLYGYPDQIEEQKKRMHKYRRLYIQFNEYHKCNKKKLKWKKKPWSQLKLQFKVEGQSLMLSCKLW